MMETNLDKLINTYAGTLDYLILLRDILNTGDCNICKNRNCKWKPQAGQMVRYNCPHFMQLSREDIDRLNNTRWVNALADDIGVEQ